MKKCKECEIIKPVDDFYHHPQTKDRLLPRCKDCIKLGRHTEYERSMARIVDNARSKTPKILKKLTENTKRFREENPEKWNAQKLVANFLRKNPSHKVVKSVVSGEECRLHFHHPDYSKPNEVIPCTPKEHRAFHNGRLIEKSEYIVALPFTSP